MVKNVVQMCLIIAALRWYREVQLGCTVHEGNADLVAAETQNPRLSPLFHKQNFSKSLALKTIPYLHIYIFLKPQGALATAKS